MTTDRKNVLVVGATSAIARETSRLFARDGARMILVGRNRQKLDHTIDDLSTRGADIVEGIQADLADFSTHAKIIETATSAFPTLDVGLFAHGVLGDQKEAEADYKVAEEIIRLNFLSVMSLLTPLANHMESRKHGSLVVISSVSGDRGRQSNYVYGASKGALSIYLQGLRNRLFRSGVKVLTVKPGFVDTPMTADFKKGPLYVTPDVIARGIYRAIEKGKDEVYLPWFWWGIMAIIKSIPELVFKRLKM